MSRLYDIFCGKSEKKYVMLYGNTFDHVYARGNQIIGFHEHLATVLRRCGFDNIVFYDASNAIGKITYDDESSYYSFQDAEDAYIQKYGAPPRPRFYTKNETAPEEVPVEPKQKETPSGTGKRGHRIGKDLKHAPSAASAAPEKTEPAPEESEKPGVGGVPFGGASAPAPARNPQTPIRRQQAQMTESSFISECRTFLTTTKFRSAVVFTDINDMLLHSNRTILRQYSQYLIQHFEMTSTPENRNLVIFLNPNIDTNSDEFTARLSEASLRNVFMARYNQKGKNTLNEQTQYVLDPERCFHVDGCCVDEIRNLLEYYLNCGVNGHVLRLGDAFAGSEEAAKRMQYELQQQRQLQIEQGGTPTKLSMDRVFTEIGNVLSDAKDDVTMDNAFFARITEYREKDAGISPMEEIRGKRGWETVFDAFNKVVQRMKENHPVAAGTETMPSFITSRLYGKIKDTCPSAPNVPHFMLVGSPGTGKTTLSRQFGRILRDAGYLSIGHVVPTKAADLISDVIGGTFRNVTQKLDEAEGGVLFVDEAHALVDLGERNDGSSFRSEAITTLVQAMTDINRHFSLIFAGYRSSDADENDGVRALFKMDPGLADRITEVIEIEDFKPDHLHQIFLDKIGERAYTVSPEIDTAHYFEFVYRRRNRRTFANARSAEKMARSCCDRADVRRHGQKETEKVLTEEDFPKDQREFLHGVPDFNKVVASLDRFPGLRTIGESILRSEKLAAESLKSRFPQTERNPRHVALVGNPGTGKTTLINLLSDAYAAVGLMSGAPPIVTNGSEATPDSLRAKIRDAVAANTLLFIDEAHNLSVPALRSLLAPMTENPRLTVAFAIYKRELAHFKELDEGVTSRISFHMIDDYPPDALGQIFECIAAREKYNVDPSVSRELSYLFDQWYRSRDIQPDYANARDVANLFQQMRENHDRQKADAIQTSAAAQAEASDGKESAPDPSLFLLMPEHIPEKERKEIERVKQNADLDTILAEFQNYVGLDQVKALIERADKVKRFYVEKFGMQKKLSLRQLHVGQLSFEGNPGTGKTVSAHLLARALFAMGMILIPQAHVLVARDLIAGYVGQTAGQARKKLEEGRHGVILIDEAYMLAADNHWSGNSFREEAVAEVMAFLDEQSGEDSDTVVIFAGYEDELQRLYNTNRGLAGRIEHIPFRDFTPEELMTIIKKTLRAEDDGYTLDEKAEGIIYGFLTEALGQPHFANARTAKGCASKLIETHIDRVLATDLMPTDEAFSVITAEDAEAALRFVTGD